MKFLIIITVLLSSLSALAENGFEEMQQLVSIQQSTYLGQKAAEAGFEFTEIKTPYIKSEYVEFREFLKVNEQKQQELFNQVVDSGELDYTNTDREQLKKEAKKYFGVPFLFEIETTYLVTKNGKFVGYIFSIIEHGQSEIYQDGAWSEVYVDKNFQIVLRDQQAA